MEISPDILDTLVNDKPMAKMIIKLEKSGGMTTREILEAMGTFDYHSSLNEAKKKGYITRKDVKKEGSVGRPSKNNVVTAKGRELAKIAKDLGIA